MKAELEFRFQDKVRDTVTGFSGQVVARSSGTRFAQYLVHPPRTGVHWWMEARWFDQDRLELVERAEIPQEAVRGPGRRPSNAASLLGG